ncbi:nocturnin isoform X1, partial [Clarias magur]
MFAVRRCSALIPRDLRDLAALCFSSPGPAPPKPPAELKHARSSPSLRAPRRSQSSPARVHVCQMGGGSSSVRLFSSLAQSLSSVPLEHTHSDAEESELEQTDPETLLRECEEVLRKRPPRPHRDFVKTRASAAHNPQIRVMQWNILAQ